MNIFQNSISHITTGFYKVAICMLIIGCIAFFASRKLGGTNTKKKKKLFELFCVIGMLLVGIFLIPMFFKV